MIINRTYFTYMRPVNDRYIPKFSYPTESDVRFELSGCL